MEVPILVISVVLFRCSDICYLTYQRFAGPFSKGVDTFWVDLISLFPGLMVREPARPGKLSVVGATVFVLQSLVEINQTAFCGTFTGSTAFCYIFFDFFT